MRCASRCSRRTRPRSAGSPPRRSRRPASCSRSARTASSPPRCSRSPCKARGPGRARGRARPGRPSARRARRGSRACEASRARPAPPARRATTGVQGLVGPPGGFGLLNLGRANVSRVSLDAGGAHSSATAGADGFPLVAVFDDTTKSLVVVHCNDAACSSKTKHDCRRLGRRRRPLPIGDDRLGRIRPDQLRRRDERQRSRRRTARTSPAPRPRRRRSSRAAPSSRTTPPRPSGSTASA